MEALGQLTGGIAHDFNNMLAIVISGLNLIERRLAKGQDVKEFLDAALDGAKRAATLTHRLLAFSRQLPLAPEALDANRLVGDMSEMLRRTLGEATPCETVLAGGLWKTHADAGQLENAILNLAINARDAMPNGKPIVSLPPLGMASLALIAGSISRSLAGLRRRAFSEDRPRARSHKALLRPTCAVTSPTYCPPAGLHRGLPGPGGAGRESENLMGEGCRTLGAVQSGVEEFFYVLTFCKPTLNEVKTADDDGQHVVEVMRDPTR